MAELEGTITLDNFIKELLLKEDKGIDIHYPRYLTFSIAGLREINMYHASNYAQVSRLTPDTLGRVDFPSDAIEIKAVGVPRGGTLWSLTAKPNMVTTYTDEGGTDTFDTDIGEGQDVPINWYSGYSATGGQNVQGYFRVDERNRKIYLNQFEGTTIWVYYVAGGVDLASSTLIPRKYQDVLEKYIRYQMASYTENVRDNEVMRKKSEYDEAVMRVRTFTWSLDELHDVWRSTNQLTPRR